MTTPFFLPDVALAQHIAIVGKTGSGKTITNKKVIEELVRRGERVCILDPIKSDYWGLTLSADGKRPGLPFDILGGPREHVPLHAGAGAAIAELVARGSLRHSILDMAGFGPGGHFEFFVDFAPVLMRRMKGVVYLVMEEAHMFAPKERSGIGKEAMSIYHAKALATAGRSTGVVLIVTTQRTQALHNAMLGSCDTMIAHRLTAPADQEPVLKWFKANADKEKTEAIKGSIASLRKGEAWVFSGDAGLFERRQIPMIDTFDNTATPDSSSDRSKVRTPPVDKDRLRAIIGEAVKEAEDNDPELLKEKVTDLERQLRDAGKAKPAAAAPAPAIDLDRVRAQTRADVLGGMRKLIVEVKASATSLSTDIASIGSRQETLAATVAALDAFVLSAATRNQQEAQQPAKIATPPANVPKYGTSVHPDPQPRATQPATTDEFQPNGTQSRLMNACKTVRALTGEWPDRKQLGWWAGVKPTGGHFKNNVGPLVSAGVLVKNADRIELDPAWQAFATIDTDPGAILGRIQDMLEGPQKRVLSVLARNPEQWWERAQLGQACDPPIDATGGHFKNNVGPMVTGGIVDRDNGKYRLAECLWKLVAA